MKTKLILRTMGLFILMVSLFVLSSCSKTSNGNLTKDQVGQKDTSLTATTVDQKDFKESDEDLTTVDYKEFYDQLAPHGEWIQVKPEEIGMKPKVVTSNSSSSSRLTIANLLGIKDANASDLDFGMIFVWQPSPDMSVNMSVGDDHEYRPYRHGQWVNTDEGWYFRAPSPWEETIHHHGRWAYSPTAGWLWIPGRLWAPAWVNWRQNDDYVSWAPLPPSDYIYDGYMNDPQIDDDYYVIVERRHFCDQDIYRYDNPYYDNGDRIYASQMNNTVGIVVVNNIIINRGPDVNVIQNFYGRPIDMVNIQHVRNSNDVRYSDKQFNVYTPDFKRYNNNQNTGVTVNQPKSFKNYNDVRIVTNSNDKLNQPNGNTKGNQPNVNTKGNQSNDNTKLYKPTVNNKMYNPSVNKPNVNNKVNQPNSNSKVNQPNSNSKVNQPNGNNKVSKPNVNPKVNQPNGNNKVSKPNVNPKVNQPNGNNKVSKPNVNPKVNQPNGNNKVSKPNVDPKVNKPNVNPKGNQPKVDEKVTQPKVDEKVNQPKVDEKVNQPKVDEKVTQPKVDEKVTQPNGNENGSNQKGNDNVDKQKVNDNGNDQKVNDNGNKPDEKDNGKEKK
jgi:hypothetical protein